MRVELQVVQGRGAARRCAMEAPSVAAARAAAEHRGLTVLRVLSSDATSVQGLGGLAERLARRSQRFDVPVFAQQLHDLLAAGLSVIEALEALLQHTASDGSGSLVVRQLVERLRGGWRLSEALRDQGAVFPDLLVALVQASEHTSDLPRALARYIEHQRQAAEVRHRLVSVAIYPAVVAVVGGLVLLFLALYVVPRFARIFEGLHGELPWAAQAMVGWSRLVSGHGMVWSAVALGLAAGVGLILRSGALRHGWMAYLMGRGIVGRAWRTHRLAQWYQAQGVLLAGGLPLPEALRLANGLLPAGLAGGGQAVLAAVMQGLSPSAAFARAGMVTPVAEQLLRAGERSGDLAGALSRTATFHDAELARQLERTMRVLEPLVMTAVGVGVGVVVVLMYLPIFELASALQ